MATSDQILQAEKDILKEEKVIELKLVEEGHVLQQIDRTRKGLIRKIAKHRFLFTLIVSTGIILVWRGIWEISSDLPIISQSLVALLMGLGILWLIERYTDLH